MIRYRLHILLLVLLGLLLAAPPGARATNYSSEEIKLAFLFNFAKFISWPKQTGNDDEFVIGIYGEETFGPALIDLKGKQVRGKRLRVSQVSTYSEAVRCQILYLGGTQTGRLSGLLAALDGRPVLTVSDVPGFIGEGGMIGLLEQDQRIRFALNLRTITAAGLRVDAQLLKLALAVVGKVQE